MSAELKSKCRFESKAAPGAVFVIRTLNSIQRARRDASIAEQRLEFTRVSAELAALRKALIGNDGTVEDNRAKYDALSIDDKMKLDFLAAKQNSLYEEYVVPANLKAGIVKIEGLKLDGQVVETVEQLYEAPDALINELYEQCQAAAGLSEEEQKNSQ